MNTPKLLPWLAHKAGVSHERATELWQLAVTEATAKTGSNNTSELWGAAQDILLELLEREHLETGTLKVVPLTRLQNHLLRLPLQAFEDLMIAFAAHQPLLAQQPLRQAA